MPGSLAGHPNLACASPEGCGTTDSPDGQPRPECILLDLEVGCVRLIARRKLCQTDYRRGARSCQLPPIAVLFQCRPLAEGEGRPNRNAVGELLWTQSGGIEARIPRASRFSPASRGSAAGCRCGTPRSGAPVRCAAAYSVAMISASSATTRRESWSSSTSSLPRRLPRVSRAGCILAPSRSEGGLPVPVVA